MARAWIVYGSPGSGKTRNAPNTALTLAGDSEKYSLKWVSGNSIIDGYIHICEEDSPVAPDEDVLLVEYTDKA